MQESMNAAVKFGILCYFLPHCVDFGNVFFRPTKVIYPIDNNQILILLLSVIVFAG